MRILLLGATGNLGLRLIPALLVHGHEVVAYVRSASKLHSLTTPGLFDAIKIYEGDALDSVAVEAALHQHACDAIMNTAGNRIMDGGEQVLYKIATAVSSAAVRVGESRGKPLRAWFIGGLGSLEYPGTGGRKVQDYMPLWMTEHHQGTEKVLARVDTGQLKWSLLCVALMKPRFETVDLLAEPQRHGHAVGVGIPPEWRDSWVRWLPFVGVYLNLVPVILSYNTMLEDVADLLAEDFDKGEKSEFVGRLVGFKDVGKAKSR
jgi:putative NADH-flavin reductase